MTEHEILAELHALRVSVAYLPYPLAGAYFHEQKIIIIDSRQTPSYQFATLAHEYIHAKDGHDGCQSESVERRVDERSALVIVDPVEYALAEYLHGGSPAGIAYELELPRWVIDAYQRYLTRVFLHSKHL